jgi:hypothetical protein
VLMNVWCICMVGFHLQDKDIIHYLFEGLLSCFKFFRPSARSVRHSVETL